MGLWSVALRDSFNQLFGIGIDICTRPIIHKNVKHSQKVVFGIDTDIDIRPMILNKTKF